MLTDASIQKHVRDLKSANTFNSKTRTHAENKVVTALDNIKSQFKVWEEISEKNSALREQVAEVRQNLDTSKKKVSKLEEDLTNKNNAETGLKKRIDELQSSQTALSRPEPLQKPTRPGCWNSPPLRAT